MLSEKCFQQFDFVSFECFTLMSFVKGEVEIERERERERERENEKASWEVVH